MKRIAPILLAAVSLSLIGIISGFTFLRSASSNTVINAKGLDSDGVLLITPANPEFEFAAPKSSQERAALIDAVGPFGVVVKNTTGNDVIACSIKWEILGPDGNIRTVHQPYSTPGILLGLEPLDDNMIGKTSLINAHSSKFLSLDPRMKQMFESADSTSNLPLTTREKNREYVEKLSSKYDQQLRSAVAITISIDGVVFSNGEYVGPDTTRLFRRLQALVDAQRDLGNLVQTAFEKGKHSVDIVNTLNSKVADSPFLLSETADKEYDQLYDRKFRNLVKELNNVKSASGDETAVNYARHRSAKDAPNLHKKDKHT
jgi:hypothetical protein